MNANISETFDERNRNSQEVLEQELQAPDLWLVSKGVYSLFNGIKMTAMTDSTFYIDI